jgi:hypothetical protein
MVIQKVIFILVSKEVFMENKLKEESVAVTFRVPQSLYDYLKSHKTPMNKIVNKAIVFFKDNNVELNKSIEHVSEYDKLLDEYECLVGRYEDMVNKHRQLENRNNKMEEGINKLTKLIKGIAEPYIKVDKAIDAYYDGVGRE